MEKRDTFLLHMYDQMFNDINRHLLVIWQSIIIIFTTLGALLLEKKEIISIDFSTSLIIIVITWFIAHVYDSCYWYNRNLVIISNIERQFLHEEDRSLIQWYFTSHRTTNKMISHLQVQFWLGIAIGALIIISHFYRKIIPTFCLNHPPQPMIFVPYIIFAICIYLLYTFRKCGNEKYQEFIQESPGKKMGEPQKKFKGHAQN